jgi:hypothetical protein
MYSQILITGSRYPENLDIRTRYSSNIESNRNYYLAITQPISIYVYSISGRIRYPEEFDIRKNSISGRIRYTDTIEFSITGFVRLSRFDCTLANLGLPIHYLVFEKHDYSMALTTRPISHWTFGTCYLNDSTCLWMGSQRIEIQLGSLMASKSKAF